MVKDHSAGGSHLLVAGVEARHLLVTSEGLPDLAFDQAEQQKGQADHRDQTTRLLSCTKMGVTASGALTPDFEHVYEAWGGVVAAG